MRRRTRLPALAAGVALGVIGYAVHRHRQSRWGASAEEVAAPMPGDSLVPRPWLSATRAITIDATREQVWPWLVQMGGYTRAGWYSYDRIDNAGQPSANRIVPELQDLAVGDVMPTAPDGTGFRVHAIDPGRSLVLLIRRPTAVVSSVFVLTEPRPGRTRLVTRLRFRVRPAPATLPWAFAVDVGDAVMFRRTLLGIRDRAEKSARRAAGTTDPEDAGHVRPLDVDLAVVVHCHPRAAYDLLAHKEHHAVRPGSPVLALDRLTPGPTRAGTRWVEVVQVLPGVRMTIRSVVERADEAAALTERFTSAVFTGRLAYTFEAVPEGTRLRQRETLHPRGPLRLLAPVMDHALRPRLLRRLADIRDLLDEPRSGTGR